MYRLVIRTLALISIAAIAGCAAYTAPGRGANLAAVGLTPEAKKYLTDGNLTDVLDKKPLAQLPTGIAVRVQAPGYESRTANSYGTGAYSVVFTRDIEQPEQIERMVKMPMVAGIAPVNRLLLPSNLQSDMDLRKAAATLHADMLLIYTLDTTFRSDTTAAPLGVITLGLWPTRNVKVLSTASAILMDTRNGYVYGVAEGTAKIAQTGNAWSSDRDVDNARQKAEAEAFEKLVGEIERMWTGVVKQYSKPIAG